MNTTAQVKQNIKKVATQMANEPLELLKTASRQVAPELINEEYQKQESIQDQGIKQEEELKQKVQQTDTRHLQALEAEILDIRRQKLFNELMQRIQAGEEVSIEEFQELTYEQRTVLKAQLEAVRNSKNQQVVEEVVEPTAKKGRKLFNFGQKQAAQRQTTRVEKPTPPSG